MNFSTEETTATIFFPPSGSPLPLLPSGPSQPAPPPSDLFNITNIPRVNEFLNNNDFLFDYSNGSVPPALDPPPLRGFAENFFPNRPSTTKTSTNVGTNTTQTRIDDHLIGELERVIEKETLKGRNCP